jgi:hypothetical protein
VIEESVISAAQSSIQISNRQSKSAIGNLNQQSAVTKSAIINRQSAIDWVAQNAFPALLVCLVMLGS